MSPYRENARQERRTPQITERASFFIGLSAGWMVACIISTAAELTPSPPTAESFCEHLCETAELTMIRTRVLSWEAANFGLGERTIPELSRSTVCVCANHERSVSFYTDGSADVVRLDR